MGNWKMWLQPSIFPQLIIEERRIDDLTTNFERAAVGMLCISDVSFVKDENHQAEPAFQKTPASKFSPSLDKSRTLSNRRKNEWCISLSLHFVNQFNTAVMCIIIPHPWCYHWNLSYCSKIKDEDRRNRGYNIIRII